MSIFGTIMSKIFGSIPSDARPAAPSADAAPEMTSSSSPSNSALSSNDLASILDGMDTGGQKLDWRHSIVDLMKLLHMDSSVTARRELAHELNYSGDLDDTSAMNWWLHRRVVTKIEENGLIIEAEVVVPLGNRIDRTVSIDPEEAEKEIVNIVSKLAGNEKKAADWYRHYKIPSFGNKTAETVACEGNIEAVKSYIARVSYGGFS